jgi:predicted RND superfamily exporter protein
VTVLFAALALVFALLSLQVKVNNNLADYLPEDAQSTTGLNLMLNAFSGSIENAQVMIPAETVQDALAVKRSLSELDGVSSVTWLDDITDLRVPLELIDQQLVSQYYKDGYALITLSIAEIEGHDPIAEIRELIGSDGALAGQAAESAALRGMVSTEVRTAMLLLLPLILIILVIASESWIEPVLYLAAIGVSVLINMGTNVFLKDVSFITQTVSPILQLAVSLDYAVFLLRRFRENRARMDTPEEAMGEAVQYSFNSIFSSAATTLFGFLALAFMKFGIGADLGLNLLKGVALSFISVILFLPALTIICVPLLDRTKRRAVSLTKSRAGEAVYKIRWLILPIVLILVAPAYMAQSQNHFDYGMTQLASQSRTGADTRRISEVFGSERPLILLVPDNLPGLEKELCATLEDMNGVRRVVAYPTAVGADIPSDILESAVRGVFEANGYRRIIIYVDTIAESEEAYSLVEQVRAEAYSRYEGASYLLGADANIYDIRDVIKKDSVIVNWIAVGAIALVLMLAFKSISLPFLLVLAIESAIWINLSIPYMTGQSLNYIGYLVVSTVQLGATVDYAILLTDKYMKARRLLGKRASIREAVSGSLGSTLVSAMSLSIAGVAMWMTSSNSIVREMGMLLARGTIFSFAMVILFLSAMLTLFDPIIRVTSVRSRFAPSDISDISETESKKEREPSAALSSAPDSSKKKITMIESELSEDKNDDK